MANTPKNRRQPKNNLHRLASSCKSLQLFFHIAEVRTFPENPPAARTEGKALGLLINKGRNQIFSPGPGQEFELSVTSQATGIGINLSPEVKMIKNLLYLLLPVFAFNEQDLLSQGLALTGFVN